MRTTETCFDLARTIWIRSCNRHTKCVRPRRADIGSSKATDVLAPQVIADWWYAGRIPGPVANTPVTEGYLGGSAPNFTITDKAGFLARESSALDYRPLGCRGGCSHICVGSKLKCPVLLASEMSGSG